MPGLKMMMIDSGTDQGIRCRFISEWYKVDTFVSAREGCINARFKNFLFYWLPIFIYCSIMFHTETRTLWMFWRIYSGVFLVFISINPVGTIFETPAEMTRIFEPIN